MTHLDDIVDIDELNRELSAGYINRRFHPEFPLLAIVGYSDKAQFDAHWTPTVKACRGIIYRTDTLEVIARPFAKFFNFGQGDANYDPDTEIVGVYNKWDGSLGIAYQRPDGDWAIATRGSFDSDQARHATALMPSLDLNLGDGNVTALFEIIYPENRIVIDYSGVDDLVPLGFIDIETGAYIPGEEPGWGMTTLREVLEFPPRKNAEGFVAWLDPFTPVKFKQADYIALHRAISMMTPKEVWRQLRAGTFDEFAAALPDEFHEWARTEQSKLTEAFDETESRARAVAEHVASGWQTRKDQARFVVANVPGPQSGLVFSLLDGKDITDSIWRMVEPKAA